MGLFMKNSVKIGRPPIVDINPEFLKKVDLLLSYGVTIDHISIILGIDRSTFYRYMQNSEELFETVVKGRTDANMAVSRALFKSAVEKGDFRAQAFWLKHRAGWGAD